MVHGAGRHASTVGSSLHSQFFLQCRKYSRIDRNLKAVSRDLPYQPTMLQKPLRRLLCAAPQMTRESAIEVLDCGVPASDVAMIVEVLEDGCLEGVHVVASSMILLTDHIPKMILTVL